jgi:hypothetical protein
MRRPARPDPGREPHAAPGGNLADTYERKPLLPMEFFLLIVTIVLSIALSLGLGAGLLSLLLRLIQTHHLG